MRRKTLSGTVLLLSFLLLVGAPVCAQQPLDYNSEQYAEYERVTSIADPVERADAILVFMREHQGLSLVQYALKSYGDLLEQFRTGGQLENYLTYAEKLIAARSDDTALANNLTQSMAYSAYQAENAEATLKYGEKAFAMAPSGNLAFILANTYFKSGDKGANFKKYGDISLKELPPNQTIEIATRLRTGAIEKENYAEAAHYSELVLKALDAMQKPDNVADTDWKTYTQSERWVSQLIIARNLYEGEKYAEAVKQFEKLTARGIEKKLRGEAYYYIGLSHWKQNQLDPAMQAFARGLVLKIPGHSEACQKYFEQLYMSTHNGSTAGMEEAIARITGSDE